MSYFILDLDTRYISGYWHDLSYASESLALHRDRWPNGRWLMAEVRNEPQRPTYETMLPQVDEERRRLSDSTQ